MSQIEKRKPDLLSDDAFAEDVARREMRNEAQEAAMRLLSQKVYLLGRTVSDINPWLGVVPRHADSPKMYARMMTLSASEFAEEACDFLGFAPDSPDREEVTKLPVGALLAMFPVRAHMWNNDAAAEEAWGILLPSDRLELVKMVCKEQLEHAAAIHQIRVGAVMAEWNETW